MPRQSAIRDFIALLGVAALFSSPASFSKSGGSGDPVPGTEQRLIYADAIVTGSKGRPVPGLGPADFSVSVGGVRGKVMSAEYVSRAAAHAADARRVIVILYDNCGSFLVASGTGELLESIAAGAVGKDDILAVLPVLEGSGALQKLAGDRRLPAVSPIETGQARMTWACGEMGDLTAANDEAYNNGVRVRRQASQPWVAGDPSYDSMISILEGLAEVPGRKNLVVMSNFWGWNDRGAGSPPIRRLTDLANRAGVAIHILDMTDIRASVNGTRAEPVRMSRHLAAVKRLAESTGGLFFAGEYRYISRNPYSRYMPFLHTGFARIVADSAAYYRLGYLAGGPGAPGAEAKLEVKVTSRSGLKVRSWGNSVPPPPASAPTREQRLQLALRSPFHGFEIGVRAFPVVSAGEPEGEAGRRLSNLRAAISVDARDLVFQDEPGGMKRAAVDVVAAAYGRDNRQAAIATDSCSLSATGGGKPPLAERVMLCELNLGMLEPGGYMVRVAVADKAGGKVGSAWAFAPVADFNIQEIGLSSLILEAPRRLPSLQMRFGVSVDSSGPPSEPPPPPGANLVDRVFAPGARVAYRFEAYGVTPDPKTGEPKLIVVLSLGGGKYLPGLNIVGDLAPIRTKPGWPVLIRGEFTIPEDAEPGPHWAHVLVRDAGVVRGSPVGCGFTVAAPAASVR